MNLTRRIFLKKGALALASIGSIPMWGPSFLQNTVFAADPIKSRNGKKVLICLFQRGAADGLSMVVPFGDPFYLKHRHEIALASPASTAGADRTWDLDGFFSLHPALKSLQPLYQSGSLAFIQACGSPNATRSHFDAQDFMESGVFSDKSIQSGWLNRTLMQCPEDQARQNAFRAVSMTAAVPRTLQGEQEVLAIPDLRNFGVGLPEGGRPHQTHESADGFESLYEGAVDEVLRGTGKESFEAMSALKKVNVNGYRPAAGVKYPNGPLGRSLMQIAQLIKADVGLEVAFAESGGWDTHANQGAASGMLASRLREWGDGIAALYHDLGNRMNDVVILTMSEFGRAVRQNGNKGTDHGHATCFMAMGGDVKGGRVLGRWPGLAPEQLFEGRDLEVTTDYRTVFSEIVTKHLGARGNEKIFPGFTPSESLGLI